MTLKKSVLFFFSLFTMTVGCFAEDFVLENQTIYPSEDKKSKIAIQWAYSAKEVNEENNAWPFGANVKPDQLQALTQKGKVEINIPEKAEYFRVVVWSKGKEDPDFLTNWIDIVPSKTYTLKTDHLVPVVLMAGMGC